MHVQEKAQWQGQLSDEHYTVNGTLIEAYASQKSFQPKDGGPAGPSGGGHGRNEEVDYRGQRRSNETHASTKDTDARLAMKSRGAEATLSYQGNVLVMDGRLRICSGNAER